MNIFDAHSHWLPQEIVTSAHFYSSVWADIEAHIKIMEESGVTQAVLSYPTSDAHAKLGDNETARLYNDKINEIVRRYPGRFQGAAILPTRDASSMASELKRATEELGLRAVSLASSYDGIFLDDEKFLPVFKTAQKYRLPVFVHSQIVNPIGSERGIDPLLMPVIQFVFDMTMCVGRLLMKGTFQEYPDVRFIFGYFGGMTAFLKHRYDATYEMLRSIGFVKDLGGLPSSYLSRIYVDTAGDQTRSNFLSSLELFGPGHILWGSDFPAKRDIRGSLEAVRSLSLTKEEKENILGGNLNRIFNEVKL